MEKHVTAKQKQQLLAIARHAISGHLGVNVQAPPETDAPLMTGEVFGSFVTLELEGDLRGCIGYIEPVAPLEEQIRLCALSAAFQDPRFVPVSRGEVDGITIEISLLMPPERVTDFDDIVVGRDGLIIANGGFHGLLLPQVAVEYGWDRDTFLSQTCWKAGLPETAWREPETVVQRFEAVIFREEA